MTINCNGFLVRSAPNNDGTWDMNITTLGIIGACSGTPCQAEANTQSSVYVYEETGKTNGTYTATIQIYKDGNLYMTNTRSISVVDGSINLIVLDTGLWSVGQDWGTTKAGKNLSFPEGKYTAQVTIV